MTSAPQQSNGRAAGFTLVELLVATAIFSLVGLALVAALRSVALTEAKIDERIATDEELRTAERFLRLTLGRASPQPAKAAEAGAPARVSFHGERTAMDWIGVMPARHGAGGLYRFRLQLQEPAGDAAGALVLQYAPLTNRDAPLESGPLEARILVHGVSDLAFLYLDADAVEPKWDLGWSEVDRLPTHVGVRIHAGGKPWPEIRVALVPTTEAAAKGRTRGASGITVGP